MLDPEKVVVKLPKAQITPEFFEKQLDDFILNGVVVLTFPPTLDSQQRKLVHELCEAKGLVSESKGSGSNRAISVYKSTSKKPSSKKLDKLPKGITEVLENFLYQGSARDAKDLAELQKRSIKNILNVTKEWPNKPTKGIKCYTLPLEDILDETVLPVLPNAFAIIDKIWKQKEKILVHCVAGKSRSAAVIIAYLMHHHGWPLQVSYNYLIQRRDIVLVNHSFMLQLVEFEKQKYGSSTMKEGDWPIGNQQARKKKKPHNPLSSWKNHLTTKWSKRLFRDGSQTPF